MGGGRNPSEKKGNQGEKIKAQNGKNSKNREKIRANERDGPLSKKEKIEAKIPGQRKRWEVTPAKVYLKRGDWRKREGKNKLPFLKKKEKGEKKNSAAHPTEVTAARVKCNRWAERKRKTAYYSKNPVGTGVPPRRAPAKRGGKTS